MKNIQHHRKEYNKFKLLEEYVQSNPMLQFNQWFHELEELNAQIEINAMTIATVDNQGMPRNRVVLLKSYSEEGFVFFTNYQSFKGQALETNNNICASFFWWPLERQVIIKGKVEKIPENESEEYFKIRPKGSQIGAIASNQSEVINGREELEHRFDQLMEQYKETMPPKPKNWGGYLIKPIEIEFWQGRESRLHDRINYTLENGNWKIERLSP